MSWTMLCCVHYHVRPGLRVGLRFKLKKKRFVYTHYYYYCHSLNLDVGDTMMKNLKILRDTIDTTFELTKLVKKYPKRDSKLTSIINDMNGGDGDVFDGLKSPKITLFCPTRWTVRAVLEWCHKKLRRITRVLGSGSGRWRMLRTQIWKQDFMGFQPTLNKLRTVSVFTCLPRF